MRIDDSLKEVIKQYIDLAGLDGWAGWQAAWRIPILIVISITIPIT